MTITVKNITVIKLIRIKKRGTGKTKKTGPSQKLGGCLIILHKQL